MNKDISKTSEEEDIDSHIDYMIQKGIFKKPSEVDKNTFDIGTDWFNSLTPKQQKVEMSKASKEWWADYGKDWMNGIYNDEITSDKMSGDVSEYWNGVIQANLQKWGRKLGVDKYRKEINKSKGKITERFNDTFTNFLNERNVKLSKKEDEDITPSTTTSI
tara:strand:- start:41 stop:523 length:483 start_codon:yes stop_codon:yes gene_type:complete